MSNSKVKKQITFSTQTLKLAEKNAEKLGLDFPEYVRYVITKDIESTLLETPNKSTAKNIRDSISQDTETLYSEEDFDKEFLEGEDEID